MSESNISWESDRKMRFKQPPGFKFVEIGDDACPTEDSECSDCLGGNSFEGCSNFTDEASGKSYKYWYPDDDKVRNELHSLAGFAGEGAVLLD